MSSKGDRPIIKLLIVDDETVERRAMCQSIDWGVIGVEVVSDAWNGRQAVERVLQERPDMILSDIKMPVMDGVEMAKMVKSIDPSIKIIFCSAYEDFEYAREAANLNAFGYVLKPIQDEELFRVVKRAADRCTEEKMQQAMYERLKSSLSLSEPLLREAVARNLLLGMRDEPAPPLRNIGLGWIQESEGHLCVLRIKWDPSAKLSPGEVKEALKAAVTDRHHAVSIHMNAHETAIILRSYANFSDTSILIEQACRQLKDRFLELYGIQAHMQFGVHAGAVRLDEVYADMVQQSVWNGGLKPEDRKGPAAAEEEGPGKYAQASDAILRLKSECAKLLHQGNLDALNRLIGQCFAVNEAAAAGSLAFHYGIGFSVLSVLLDAVKKRGIEPFAQADDEILCWVGLTQTRSVAEIETYLRQRAEEFVNRMRSAGQRSDDKFIEQIRNIVKNHYQSTLTVEKIAQIMHFTPNYLGSVFKSKMKISLNDYINKYRISQSMRLLRDPSLSIGDVAKMCGYENTPYFHKIFKKLTGMTPGAYRLLEETTSDEILD
jgi:two-component system response regulator YesN